MKTEFKNNRNVKTEIEMQEIVLEMQ